MDPDGTAGTGLKNPNCFIRLWTFLKEHCHYSCLSNCCCSSKINNRPSTVLKDHHTQDLDEDLTVIKTANLPILWIIGGMGVPIQAVGDRLADLYFFHHIKIDPLLKEELSLGTHKEGTIRKFMRRGVALPRRFMISSIKREMADAIVYKNVQGFLFTDYPRSYPQANYFIKEITMVDYAVVIKLDENTSKLGAFHVIRRQILSSNRLKRTKDQIRNAADEQVMEQGKDLQKICRLLGNKMKVVDGRLEVKDVFKELMRWIERAVILHGSIPPLIPHCPVGLIKDEDDGAKARLNSTVFLLKSNSASSKKSDVKLH